MLKPIARYIAAKVRAKRIARAFELWLGRPVWQEPDEDWTQYKDYDGPKEKDYDWW